MIVGLANGDTAILTAVDTEKLKGFDFLTVEAAAEKKSDLSGAKTTTTKTEEKN